MPNVHEPVLVNTIGHSAGALIFAIFIALLLRQYGWSTLRRGGLSVAAATLALLWNAGSVLALTLGGAPEWQAAVMSLSFSALSLLPAVLLHVSLESRSPRLVMAGYILGLAAAGVHSWEVVSPVPELHRLGLRLITGGFFVLTLAAAASLAFHGGRSRIAPSRLLATMCLALFSLSFAHFHGSGEHLGSSTEVLLHHAGIPLALFILLQDYRFVLLDAFVRFLANALLAAGMTFLIVQAAIRLEPVYGNGASPLPQALLLVALGGLLIAFAVLRNGLQAWLGRVVFRRPDGGKLLATLRAHPGISSEPGYLPWAVAELARAMESERHELVADEPGAAREEWVEAEVTVRLSKGGARRLLLGRRRGGRRYLSEELALLGRAAAAIAEEVEDFRAAEMQHLVAQAELRALQAQINPHFLFNALNTVYGIIPREAAGARATVLNLAEIFRYLLRSDSTYIPLAEEVRIIRAYLEVEKLRLGARLETEIEVEEHAGRALIPVLSVQPLVENAVKYGVASHAGFGRVRLSAHAAGESVTVRVENTPGTHGRVAAHSGFGLGLANVRRRLKLCFGPEADVTVRHEDDRTVVEFSVPFEHRAAAEVRGK
ncbi:MAG TPA: histidine kinase [Bryobacteraceae bacterium]|nr:histidine kinase [Bryobacteraceae bacterium]